MNNIKNSSNQVGNTGTAGGQTKEKASGRMASAKDCLDSADRDSMQHARQQIKEKAQGAADVVKDKTGMNKNS